MRSHWLTRTLAVKRAYSLLCLALFLSLQALATVPELHRLIHHDADKADHHCAITLLAQGNIDLVDGATPQLVPTVFISENSLTPVLVLNAVDYQLPPDRGPPSLLS